MLGLNGKLLDFIYPVGSYYETSDTSFNPNTAWGGTWVEDTKGRVTVALDSDDIDFDTINETGGGKTHYHSQTLRFSSAYANGQGCQYTNGSTVATETIYTGTSSSLPPYVVVKRWHRTA